MGKVPLGYIYIICSGFRKIEFITQLKYWNSSDISLMYHEELQSAYSFSVFPIFSYILCLEQKRMLFCTFAILKYEKSFEY
jgi:hypothetical protein